jgi:hypothetical protein
LETREEELNQEAQAPIAGAVTLEIKTAGDLSFDRLSDLLLIEVTKLHAKNHGKISLRSLAKNISMSRSTLSARLRALVDRKLIDLESLAKMVGISDKT